MKYEELVKHTIANLNVSYRSEAIGFNVLKQKLEEQLRSDLNNDQLDIAKKILVNLNPVDCETCTPLPGGWIAK